MNAASIPSLATTAPVEPAQPAHLLIIDDRVDELRLLIALVRHEGYRLSVAFDGAQGYQRAQALQPDLIIMDVSMPVLNGFDACRLLQSDNATRHIPIIFLSSSGELESRLQGLHTGGVDYVVKPYEPEEVLARIRIHLRRGTRSDFPVQAQPEVDGPVAHGKDRTLVNAACQYLVSALARPPGMAQLAKALLTNEKRLSRAFRNELGITVFEFVRQERLRRATRMLLETSLSVTQIAEELGYSSSANFATSFRNHTGHTPSAFRSNASDIANR